MRFDWDDSKNDFLKRTRKIDFDDVKYLFFNDYFFEDRKSDDPEQFFAVGFVKEKLITVVYEVREDAVGEYYWLITCWKSTKFERALYEKAK